MGCAAVGLFFSFDAFQTLACLVQGIATGLGGWEWNYLPLWQRAVRLFAAVLLIVPGVPSGLAGGGILAGCLFLNLRSRRAAQ